MSIKTKKWRWLAIAGYSIPLIFFALEKIFTKWGADDENCAFAFLVGVFVECIIGVCGLIGICTMGRCKERVMFLFNIIPLFLIAILYVIASCYA